MHQMTLDEFLPMDRDPLTKEVARFLVTRGKVSIGAVQSRFRLGFRRADAIMQQLVREGIIGEDYLATNPGEPLMTEEELKEWMKSE